MRLIGHQGITC